MTSIKVVSGIKAEPATSETESFYENKNIFEISIEDVRTEVKEEVEQNIKLEDNANNIVEISKEVIQTEVQEEQKYIKLEDNANNWVEIGIEDIKDEGNTENLENKIDINMEMDSRPKPDKRNTEALEKNVSNNMKINFQYTEDVKRKGTGKSFPQKSPEIVGEQLLLNYADNIGSIRKRYKTQEEKMKKCEGDNCKVGLDDYTVAENQQYCCNNCQFLTTNKKIMRVHVRNNHRNEEFASSMNEEDLKNALEARAESSDNKRVVSWYEYKLDGENKYRCNHCQTVVKSEKEMFNHILDNHRKMKMKQCPHCPYQTRYEVSSHITSVHTAEEDLQYFRCDKCESKFKLKSVLRRHMETHMESIVMKHCLQCPKMFKSTNLLSRHIRNVHNKDTTKKLKCFHCHYQCLAKCSMKLHLQTRHTNIEDLETLQCELCPYKTKFKATMKTHTTLKHKRLFQCHICSYKCAKKYEMDLHLVGHKKKKDEEDLKYHCNKCDYKTYRWYNLKVHKLNHLKPEEIEYFYCYHCDFKTKRKDNLKNHIHRHQKKEELPFQCYICDFTSKKRDQLIRHLDMHSKTAKKGKAPKIRVIRS